MQKVYAQNEPKSPTDHNKKPVPKKNKQRKVFKNPKDTIVGSTPSESKNTSNQKETKTSVLHQPSQGRISFKIMIPNVCHARKWKRKKILAVCTVKSKY
jgi:hypothetical protein